MKRAFFWQCSFAEILGLQPRSGQTYCLVYQQTNALLKWFWPRYHWDKTNMQLNNSFIEIYAFFDPKITSIKRIIINVYKFHRQSMLVSYLCTRFHRIYMWPLSFSKWYKIRLVMTIHNIASSRLAFRLCGRKQHLKGTCTKLDLLSPSPFFPSPFLPVSLAFNLLLRSLFSVKTQKQT